MTNLLSAAVAFTLCAAPAPKPAPPAPPRTPAPKMVAVPGGSFQYGSELDQREKPVRKVSLSPFLLAAHETTLSLYDEFCAATGRPLVQDNGWGRGDQPARYLDWYDAVEFCNWLSAREGLTPAYTITKDAKDPTNTADRVTLAWTVKWNRKADGYRLPTEAEWTYACLAGSKTQFSAPRLSAALANYDASQANKYLESDPGPQSPGTKPVGSYPANAWGLFDLHGNVSEWVWDWYDHFLPDQVKDHTNPTGAAKGSERVMKGGNYFNWADVLRCSARNFRTPDYGRDPEIPQEKEHLKADGFRVARNAK